MTWTSIIQYRVLCLVFGLTIHRPLQIEDTKGDTVLPQDISSSKFLEIVNCYHLMCSVIVPDSVTVHARYQLIFLIEHLQCLLRVRMAHASQEIDISIHPR